MIENAQKIERMILVTLSPDETPDEQRILVLIQNLRQIYPIDEADLVELVKSLHSRLAIRMDVGTILVADDHEPWLSARKPTIKPAFWDRYQKFLFSQNWAPAVVTTLDRVTDEILDGCGDPSKESAWARRGLVMGDVQSGKTSTYTGLSCKAADAGYRLIVLLTGTLESLRRQTQERLDEGFVGLDSARFLSKEKLFKFVGAGLIDQGISAAAFTSRESDFSTRTMTALNFRLASFKDPILLVVKKNKKILDNLEEWLGTYNAGADGKISLPMMLIDDEADNASVNVSAKGEDPKAINAGIRALLNLFHRSTYVGFTATPFANIFIEPETPHAMLGDDLFPRDFLYALEPPSNYEGPESIFYNSKSATRLLEITDAEACFPKGHKSTYQVEGVPGSLKSAVRAFIIANAIRDLRNEGPTHRSMLVNVSRFTLVQSQVADILDFYLRTLQQDIRNYSQLLEKEALANESLAEIHECWKKNFQGAGFSWRVVQQALSAASLPITVKAVNQKTGAASLDYRKHKKTGLRVIAVGGNSLSRGITLEGLSESYFFRDSQMYDTLLQMGRWFGYRDGYSDLCRVWLTPDAQSWYAYITLATLELREELKRMRRLGMTPKDFGLKVRANPNGLIVTARNKMRNAKTIEKMVSLSDQYVETPRLWDDENRVSANAAVVNSFLETLRTYTCEQPQPTDAPLWREVDKAHVISLLRAYDPHPYNYTFQADELVAYLEASHDQVLDKWDVTVPTGSVGVSVELPGGVKAWPQERTVTEGGAKDLLASGKSARVASRGAVKAGMGLRDIADAEEDFRRDNPNKEVSDHAYLLKRRRPLLLLHLLELRKVGVAGQEKNTTPIKYRSPFWALGLGFPQLQDARDKRPIRYRINLVEWKARFEVELDDDVDAGSSDDNA